jgi:hypothetical protein
LPAASRRRTVTIALAIAIAAATTLCFALAYLVVGRDSDGTWLPLCRWDCHWYRSIIERGYDPDPRLDPRDLQANYAFYPAFPLVAGALMAVTPLNFTQVGLLLGLLYSGLFSWLALTFHRELHLPDQRAAIAFLVAFLLSPLGVVNHVPYTEMQFNLAALATFIAWRREHYLAAALSGVVLTATRLPGVILPLALLVELLARERWRFGPLLAAPDARVRALAVMPLGLGGFLVYLGLHTGDPLASLRIQHFGWNQGMNDLLLNLATGLFARSNTAALGVVVVVGVTLLLGFGVRRGHIPLPLAALAFFSYALPALSRMASVPRFALALFPVYLLVPLLPPRWRLGLIVGFAVLQFLTLHLWLDERLVMV